jgi:hypothetical protein
MAVLEPLAYERPEDSEVKEIIQLARDRGMARGAAGLRPPTR